MEEEDKKSSVGLNNADFARLFRQEARQERDQKQQDDDANEDLRANPMHQAAMRMNTEEMKMEEDNTPLDADPPSIQRFGIAVGKTIPLPASTERTFSWEKHSTGFASKMMAKMGFKKRLGKNEDGVSGTIEVKVRPAQMGIGFGKFAEASALKHNRKLQEELKGETFDKEEDQKQRKRATEEVQEDDSLWRKRKALTGRKKYKRAADVTREVQTKQKRPEVILDMRGPDVRVLSNVVAAYDVDPQQLEAAEPKLGEELIYNVLMVVNLSQGKIYDLTQKIEANTETMVSMKKEAKIIRTQLDIDALRLRNVKDMMEKLQQLQAMSESASQTGNLQEILTQLRDIRYSYPQEFEAYNLYQLVPSLCIPILKVSLSASSLTDRQAWHEIVEQYRAIQIFLLEVLPVNQSDEMQSIGGGPLHYIREKVNSMGDDTYNFILEETLWPVMVHFVNVLWDVRDASFCGDLFVLLRPHLSNGFQYAFLHQLVLPRLKKECHRWNPHTDTSLIHEWLAPWTRFLEKSLDTLYPEIQLTLANASNAWHPSDLSLLPVLTPWRELWGELDYAKFTHRHIMRKLTRCLHRDFVINPQNQSLDALSWVLAWKQHLPERQFIALFEGEFFPKWLKTLRKWVLESPDLMELEKWYCGWKSFFEKNGLATHPRLLIHFQGALVLLDAAANAVDLFNDTSKAMIPELNRSAAKSYQEALVKAREDDPDGDDGEASSDGDTKPKPVPPKKKPSGKTGTHYVGLKDVIENLAISNNLTFMPTGFHDGQQVYLFGKHHILIDQGVVYVQASKGTFKPVDIEQLL